MGGPCGINIVQNVGEFNNLSTITWSPPLPTTAGNLLVVSLAVPHHVSATAPSGWQQAFTTGVSIGLLYVFYYPNAPSITSATFNISTTADTCLNGIEVTGLSAGGTLDVNFPNTGSGSTVDTGTSPTLASSCEIAIASFLTDGSLLGTPSSPFTDLGGSQASPTILQVTQCGAIVTSTAPLDCSQATQMSTVWSANMVSFF